MTLAIRSPSSLTSPIASYRDMTRSTADASGRDVGRAFSNVVWPARRIARRAYGLEARIRAAVIASDSPAACPIAGPPRIVRSRISLATSTAVRHSISTISPGSRRWSTRINRSPSTRNEVRNPVAARAARTGSAAGCGASTTGARTAAAGLRIAPAASSELRCRAPAAPITVTAVWAISVAKDRKKRRRPRSTPESAAGSAGGVLPAAGSARGRVAGGGRSRAAVRRGRAVDGSVRWLAHRSPRWAAIVGSISTGSRW